MPPPSLEPQETVLAVSKAIIQVLKHSSDNSFVTNTLTSLQATNPEEAERHLRQYLWLTLHRLRGVDIPPEVVEEITTLPFKQELALRTSRKHEEFLDGEELTQNLSQDNFYPEEEQAFHESPSFLLGSNNEGKDNEHESRTSPFTSASPAGRLLSYRPFEYDHGRHHETLDLLGHENTSSTPQSCSINQNHDLLPASQIGSCLPSPIEQHPLGETNHPSDIEILRQTNDQSLLEDQDFGASGNMFLSFSIQESIPSDPSLRFSRNNCLEESQLLAGVDACFDCSSPDDCEKLQEDKSESTITHRIDKAMALFTETTLPEESNLSHSEMIDIALSEISDKLSKNINDTSYVQDPQKHVTCKDKSHEVDEIGKSKGVDYETGSQIEEAMSLLSREPCSSKITISLNKNEGQNMNKRKWSINEEFPCIAKHDEDVGPQATGVQKETLPLSDMIDMALTRLSHTSSQTLHDPVSYAVPRDMQSKETFYRYEDSSKSDSLLHDTVIKTKEPELPVTSEQPLSKISHDDTCVDSPTSKTFKRTLNEITDEDFDCDCDRPIKVVLTESGTQKRSNKENTESEVIAQVTTRENGNIPINELCSDKSGQIAYSESVLDDSKDLSFLCEGISDGDFDISETFDEEELLGIKKLPAQTDLQTQSSEVVTNVTGIKANKEEDEVDITESSVHGTPKSDVNRNGHSKEPESSSQQDNAITDLQTKISGKYDIDLNTESNATSIALCSSSVQEIAVMSPKSTHSSALGNESTKSTFTKLDNDLDVNVPSMKSCKQACNNNPPLSTISIPATLTCMNVTSFTTPDDKGNISHPAVVVSSSADLPDYESFDSETEEQPRSSAGSLTPNINGSEEESDSIIFLSGSVLDTIDTTFPFLDSFISFDVSVDNEQGNSPSENGEDITSEKKDLSKVEAKEKVVSEEGDQDGDEVVLSEILNPGEPLLTSTPFVLLHPNVHNTKPFSLNDKAIKALNMDMLKDNTPVKDHTPVKDDVAGKHVEEPKAESESDDDSESLLKGMAFDAVLELSRSLGCEPFDRTSCIEKLSCFRHSQDNVLQKETQTNDSDAALGSLEVAQRAFSASVPNVFDKEVCAKSQQTCKDITNSGNTDKKENSCDSQCYSSRRSSYFPGREYKDKALYNNLRTNVDEGNSDSLQKCMLVASVQENELPKTESCFRGSPDKGFYVDNQNENGRRKDDECLREPLRTQMPDADSDYSIALGLKESEKEILEKDCVPEDFTLGENHSYLNLRDETHLSSILESFHSSNANSDIKRLDENAESQSYSSFSDETQTSSILESFHSSNASSDIKLLDKTAEDDCNSKELLENPRWDKNVRSLASSKSVVSTTETSTFFSDGKDIPVRDPEYLKGLSACDGNQVLSIHESFHSHSLEQGCRKENEISKGKISANALEALSSRETHNSLPSSAYELLFKEVRSVNCDRNETFETNFETSLKEASLKKTQESLYSTESSHLVNISTPTNMITATTSVRSPSNTRHHTITSPLVPNNASSVAARRKEQGTQNSACADSERNESPAPSGTSDSQELRIDRRFLDDMVSKYFPVQFSQSADIFDEHFLLDGEIIGGVFPDLAFEEDILSDGLFLGNEDDPHSSSIKTVILSQKEDTRKDRNTHHRAAQQILKAQDNIIETENETRSNHQKEVTDPLRDLGAMASSQGRLNEPHYKSGVIELPLIEPPDYSEISRKKTASSSTCDRNRSLSRPEKCTEPKEKSISGFSDNSLSTKNDTQYKLNRRRAIPEPHETWTLSREQEVSKLRDTLDVSQLQGFPDDVSSLENDVSMDISISHGNSAQDEQIEAMEWQNSTRHELTYTMASEESGMAELGIVETQGRVHYTEDPGEPMVWE